jgi:hypothetical protein
VATICELLSPLISSVLMLKDPWIPVLLGFSVFLLGSVVTLITLPETLPQHPSPESAHGACTTTQTGRSKLLVMKERLWALLAGFRQNVDSIFAINGIVFLLFGFFATTIGSVAGGFELQYGHKRFGWSYSFVSPISAF